MSNPWEIIGAIATAVAAIGSITALYFEIKNSRKSKAVDIVLQFDSKFNSDEWRERRARAAREIRQGTLNNEAENILDFFESIAFLTDDRKVLDKETIWHYFSYWIFNYYEYMLKRIDERQAKDPTIWQDLAPFVASLREIQMQKANLNNIQETHPDLSDLEKFLNEEISEGAPRHRSSIG